MLYALYKFTWTWTAVASTYFPISNYTGWSGRGSKEWKILKQIPPLSRQNKKPTLYKVNLEQKGPQLQTCTTNTSKYVP